MDTVQMTKINGLAMQTQGQAPVAEQGQAPVAEQGQAVVEFVFTLLLFLGVIMVFVQIGLNLGVANYFQYATYMSARTLAAAGASAQEQIERADRVLRSMVTGRGGKERWPALAKNGPGKKPPRDLASVKEGSSTVKGASIGPGQGFEATQRDFSWIEGVQYTFHSKVFLPAGGTRSEDNELTLTSETWLGREPSYQECVDQLRQKAKGGENEYDNGC